VLVRGEHRLGGGGQPARHGVQRGVDVLVERGGEGGGGALRLARAPGDDIGRGLLGCFGSGW
jgi:hypothetical protein